jgi:ABC-type transporter Mla MlaB component
LAAPYEPPQRAATELTIAGPLERGDIPELCDKVRRIAELAPEGPLVCNVADALPDAVTVDALAHVQLTARRLGTQLRLEGASPELCDLMAFFGLRAALSARRGSAVEVGRQAEEREQRLGVEKEVDPADPPT